MTEQFKVGDWVEVVDNSGDAFHFSVGEVVQVKSVAEVDHWGLGSYLEFYDKPGGMYSYRFKKVSPPLPDVFQYTYCNSLYTATKTDTVYEITKPNTFYVDTYKTKQLREYIDKGLFKILPPTNGVDGQNNPLNFTKDMLKPMMRFVTANGQEWIVTENVQNDSDCKDKFSDCKDKFIGVGDGWTDFDLSTAEGNVYAVVAVYAAPNLNRDLLSSGRKGPLIWKRVEQPKAAEPEPSPLQKRLDYLQVHIDAVKENVESLEKEMAELQEEVGNV